VKEERRRESTHRQYSCRPRFQFANLLVTHEAKDNYNVIRALARHLSKKGALHKVRLLSRRSAQLFSSVGATNGIYKRLFVSPLYTDPHAKRDKSAFTRIAYGCTELVVTLRECYGSYNVPPGIVFSSSAVTSTHPPHISDWPYIFVHCPNLTTLTIFTDSCTTGNLWNKTSSALTAVRTAFEQAGLMRITTLRMAPADMIYIGQFR
jgi:hypothetical protein